MGCHDLRIVIAFFLRVGSGFSHFKVLSCGVGF